jgi:hypothetical protein
MRGVRYSAERRNKIPSLSVFGLFLCTVLYTTLPYFLLDSATVEGRAADPVLLNPDPDSGLMVNPYPDPGFDAQKILRIKKT